MYLLVPQRPLFQVLENQELLRILGSVEGWAGMPPAKLRQDQEDDIATRIPLKVILTKTVSLYVHQGNTKCELALPIGAFESQLFAYCATGLAMLLDTFSTYDASSSI